jgi:NADPH:quinone reductase-like Zn-dependent oxidoreductase
MKAIELQRFGRKGLSLVARPEAPLGPGEVRVRVLAASLNYRDIEILEGRYGMPVSLPIVPLSDSVGEVVEIGDGVTRFALGDRVNPIFFPDWVDGEFRADYFKHQPGSSADGVLQELVTVPESALVRAPANLGVEGATLPVAALTAWNVLRDADIIPGQTVLVLGSGGVSLFALQFARLFGARAIAVSSSRKKADRLSALGASEVIDSGADAAWGEQVLRLTDSRGVDLVVEVGGAATLPQSSVALKMGGHIAIIGYLSGAQATVDLKSLFIGKRARVHGHTVGSRASFEEMNRAIELHRLQPVIDSTFPLERTGEAYDRAQSRDVFGKVLITMQ